MYIVGEDVQKCKREVICRCECGRHVFVRLCDIESEILELNNKDEVAKTLNK